MTVAFETVARELAEHAERLARSVPASERAILRVEVPIPRTDPLGWLAAWPSGEKLYWTGRDGCEETAGLGAAVVVYGDDSPALGAIFSELRHHLEGAHPNLRFYGGMRFDKKPARELRWRRAGVYRFLVPRVELIRRGDDHFAVWNVSPDNVGDARAIHELLDGRRLPDTPWEGKLPPVKSRIDRPDRASWAHLVKGALEAFESGSIQKAVLARETTFALHAPLDPVVLLTVLQAVTASSFHFCFQFDQDTAFLGASPELLYRREGRRIRSEALAGTRPRGRTPLEDDALAADLLASDKDLREHRFVVDSIRSTLGHLCSRLHVSEDVALMKLNDVQHLLTPMEGLLRAEVDDAEILERLHPTPALGGVPTDKAVALIEALEPFERGWYAGPVGWVGADQCEFAVAIRSALVHDRNVSVYTGAGLVPGSQPDQEWDELENKLKNFARILGL